MDISLTVRLPFGITMVDDGSGKALMSNKAPLTALTIPALTTIKMTTFYSRFLPHNKSRFFAIKI